MIVRTYGRRNRSLPRGYTETMSQESPHDVYDFGFSSQDSAAHFDSEPYGCGSSQEFTKLAILPPREDAVNWDFDEPDGVFWKPKSSGVIDLGSDSYDPGSSQQLKKSWDFDDSDGFSRKSKKTKVGKSGKENKKVKKKGVKSKDVEVIDLSPTVTLMETQEYGEMMEHVDEVNFALDGLRKGQPARIRRASLLSLLSICGTIQQRRLLRAHGMAKTIIDAILGLSFDDSPSNLAAAALFYILTCDGQDDHLLDSPSCIRFLIKLVKPYTSDIPEERAPTIGRKLLAIRLDADVCRTSSQQSDSTSAAIMLKVQDILASCKETKPADTKDNEMERHRLNPKWISLLAMEKACLSTVSIEDTSGAMRRTGGNFKEKFRELGGLDAVFDVARNCHSVLEGWLEESSSPLDSKDTTGLESLVLLLKCLKIMENATFLSKDNQSHLLEMKGKLDNLRSPRSFIKLILSFIKILSGVSLLRRPMSKSQDENNANNSYGTSHASQMSSEANNGVDNDELWSITSSIGYHYLKEASQNDFSVSPSNHRMISDHPGSLKSNQETATTSTASRFSRIRHDSSSSRSSAETSGKLINETALNCMGMKSGVVNVGKRINETNFEIMDDSQDPFAFDGDDVEPSRWDLLYGQKGFSQMQNRISAVREHGEGCQSLYILSQQESNSMDNDQSSEPSCSSKAEEEKSILLADCLLAAVKVLMNLTNDNPVGCQQIADCGGLETLASLIAGHFPSFSLKIVPCGSRRENGWSSRSRIKSDDQKDVHLTDQELDFLVAVLGLLVNLVEKHGNNRSRLAAASVTFPLVDGLDDSRSTDVIPLLCSIFLANQGAGEVAGEGKLSWDDEEALLQGEKEAEKMIVEAYAALLLAFLSTESKSIRNEIAECLPENKLRTLVPVLERFVEFHLSLNMISPETHSTVLEVIESCRIP